MSIKVNLCPIFKVKFRNINNFKRYNLGSINVFFVRNCSLATFVTPKEKLAKIQN